MAQSELLAVTDGREAHHPASRHDYASWFALRIRSNREFKVQTALQAGGVPEFLPTFSTETRWSDRTNTTVRPLFAGYIFSRFDPALYEPRNIAGVCQILGQVSDGEIANLRLVVASRVPAAPCPYVAGDAVTVESGPLAGLTGVIKRVKGAASLLVSIEILRRTVSVELEAGTVVKAV